MNPSAGTRLYRAAEMRAADEAAAKQGVAFVLLMESAARAVAAAALRHFPEARRIVVLAGKGNNGGDAYGAARHLLLAGKEVTLLELASEAAELASHEARTMRAAWLAYPAGKTARLERAGLEAQLSNGELVVDGLFGSGLTRPLTGELAALIEGVNAAPLPVLSIDLPSGLGSDSGRLLGPHVRAARTLQLAGPKRASVLYPAASAFGSWEVADIGVPAELLEREATASVLEREAVRAWLPERDQDTHKYEVGTVLVAAGSARYGGAALLASHAALRAGAGLVTLASAARGEGVWPELIVERMEGWSDKAVRRLLELPESRRQRLVIGPGLDEDAKPLVASLLETQAPTVLDAGALVGDDAWWEAVRAHGSCVLTPHSGEAAPLLGLDAAEVRAEPLEAATALADKARAVVVLKGRTTTVAAPGRVAVSTRGHPGMATGGSGDVLAGLLGAWLARGQLFERSCAAVYLHGLAGERAARRYGDGLIASDLIAAFALVWRGLTRA